MKRQRRLFCMHHASVVLFLVILIATVPRAGAQNSKDAPGAKGAKSASPMPSSDQLTNIPYFSLRDGMNSTLTLNNIVPSTMPVTVTIYNHEGRAQVLDPIIVPPLSFKQIDLRDVVPSDLFEEGNIQVSYSGMPMAVTCQLTVFSIDKKVSFESREQDMMDFMSSRLNGIAWLPGDAAGFLALTNTAPNKVTIGLSIGSEKSEVILSPRQTRVLKLNDPRSPRSEMAALVELQHDGMPGDIITTGFVLNLKEGYSSSFSMSDPAVMRSNNLSGAHFRFGGPDPGEEFPKGTNFRAPLFVANVGTQSVRTHVTVDYTPLPGDRSEAQQGAVVTVKDLTIAPGQVQRVELTDELARLGVKGPVAEDGVDITYDGAPGSIIAELTSVDQSGNYSFEVPIKDPSAMNVMDEGVYPWTLEGGTNTVVHLKNSTNEHAQAIVLFSFAGGSYNLEPVDLAPYQTMAIDIQKLKDLKKPDVRKQVFPEDATHGQVAWLQRTPYSMIGRAESVNLKEGIASSFSCGAQCCTANLWEEDFCESLDGSSCSSAISGDVGDSGTLVGLEYGHFCNGSPWGPNTQTPNSWSSDNTSVATVSSGTVTLVGAGTANISADFTQLQYAYGEDGYCGGVWYDYPGPAVAAKSCDFTITPSTGNLTPAYCDALTLNTTTFSATISGGCTVVPSNSSCTYSYSGTASVDGSSYADINQTYNYANCVMKYYAGTGTGTIQLDMNLKFYEAPHVLTHTSIQGISCP